MADSEHKDETKKTEGIFHKCSVTKYRKNTRAGYKGFKWQAHHVLSAVCFVSIKHDNLEYILDCLRVTDWDINKSYNMVGLPVVRSYILAYQDQPGTGQQQGKREFKQLAKWLGKVTRGLDDLAVGKLKDMPCHNPMNWGHTDYMLEVSSALEQIWDQLVKEEGVHASAAQLKPKLHELADEFKAKLRKRGARNNGTAFSWAHRHDPVHANTWFHPFNMSKEPVKQALF